MGRKRKLADCDNERHYPERKNEEVPLHSNQPLCVGPGSSCPFAANQEEQRYNLRKIRKQAAQLTRKVFRTSSKKIVLKNRYKLTDALGQGGYGTVVRAIDLERCKEPKTVAIKIVKKSLDTHSDGVREILTLRKICELDPKDQRHCARLLDSFCHQGHLCLVFDEYGRTLKAFCQEIRCGPFKPNEVRHIGRQLCEAIEFLHGNRLTHNDIKPDNIVFVNKALKTDSICGVDCFDVRLIDFGSVARPNDTHDVARTQYYCPPEFLLLNFSSYCYDVWSIACTLYELYMGEVLFLSKTPRELFALMEHVCGKLPRSLTQLSPLFKSNGTVEIDRRTKKYRSVCSSTKWNRLLTSGTPEEQAFFELLKQMLDTDPAKRLTLKEICKHKFFRQPAVVSGNRNASDASATDPLSDAPGSSKNKCVCV